MSEELGTAYAVMLDGEVYGVFVVELDAIKIAACLRDAVVTEVSIIV